MATIDNASIVRDIYQAFNDKAPDRLTTLCQPDAKMTNVPFSAVMSYRDYFMNWVTAFPDGKVEIVNLVAQGDKVICEFIGRGTHTGVLQGPGGAIQPTNKRLELRFVECYDCRNGKVANGRIYFDSASLMNQLGLIQQLPAMASKITTQPLQKH